MLKSRAAILVMRNSMVNHGSELNRKLAASSTKKKQHWLN